MGVHKASGQNSLNYGLDFMGGTSTTADFGKEYTIEDIENDIIPVVKEVTGDSNIQANKVEGTTQITIKTRTLSKEERDDLNNKLADSFDVDESTITFQSISSTISGEMRADAVKAVIISTICMLIYIWFRFKDIRFATSAVLALLHDVLVVLTFYAARSLLVCIKTVKRRMFHVKHSDSISTAMFHVKHCKLLVSIMFHVKHLGKRILLCHAICTRQ